MTTVGRKRAAKASLSLIAVVSIAYLMLRWFEHSHIYYPDRQLAATGAELGRPFEDVYFRTGDGVKLNGWFYPATTNSPRGRHVILLCHGNAGNISHRLDLRR